MSHLLLSLLRYALWHNREGVPSAVADNDSEMLLQTARQQAVAGLVIDALVDNNVRLSQKHALNALGMLEHIKRHSRQVNEGVVALHKILTAHDVDYRVVKGQLVASYYPDSLLRQSGDIDYYCDTDNFDKGLQCVKNYWGVSKVGTHSSGKHVDFRYNGNIYEGHVFLLSFPRKVEERYWQHLLGADSSVTINIDGYDIKTLSPTVHVLFVFLHLFHHLMALGVGLRQFCDMAVMLHYGKEEIDMDALRRHLKALSMERVWKACGGILVDNLGMPEDDLGYVLSDIDRRYARKMLSVVMYRGNMGHYNKRGGFRGWRHKVESGCIKIAHFMKFMPLTPMHSVSWVWDELSRNFFAK